MPSRSKRILIIGGTRFMGPHLVRFLINQGHSVAVFNRGQASAVLPPNVQRLKGDRNNLRSHVQDLLALDPDIIIDMVCLSERQANEVLSIFNGKAERVVLVSSCDVYKAYGVMLGIENANLQKLPLREDSPLRDRLYPYRGATAREPGDPQRWLDEYDKISCEQAVLSHSSLAGTVARLPVVYGPRDRQHRLYPYLSQMDNEAEAIKLSPAHAAWRCCRGYCADMAYGIALCAVSPAAAGRVYNIAHEPNYTEGDWVRLVGKAAGWTGKVVPTVEIELDAGFYPMQHLSVDTTRIRNELGFTQQVPLDEALAQTVMWERLNPPQGE